MTRLLFIASAVEPATTGQGDGQRKAGSQFPPRVVERTAADALARLERVRGSGSERHVSVDARKRRWVARPPGGFILEVEVLRFLHGDSDREGFAAAEGSRSLVPPADGVAAVIAERETSPESVNLPGCVRIGTSATTWSLI